MGINADEAARREASLDKDYVVVNGLRYVVPYVMQQDYSVRDKHCNTPALDVLAETFRLQRGTQDLDEARDFWRSAFDEGRVTIKRSKLSRDDVDPYTQSYIKIGPDFVVRKQDRLKITKHQHSRAIGGGEVKVLKDDGRYVALYKPACVPVVDGSGGRNCIVDIAQRVVGAKIHLVHRLDSPVSGLLLMARGGTHTRAAMKELAERRCAKLYIARVEGRFPDAAAGVTCAEPLGFKEPHGAFVQEVAKGGKIANTNVTLLHYFPEHDESLVLAAPVTGLRHQIRAHLSHLQFPICNDVRYGGGKRGRTDPDPVHRAWVAPEAPRAYEDDAAGTLQKMWERTEEDWCHKCTWVKNVLSGDHHLDLPVGETHICLHAVRYEVCPSSPSHPAPLHSLSHSLSPDTDSGSQLLGLVSSA